MAVVVRDPDMYVLESVVTRLLKGQRTGFDRNELDWFRKFIHVADPTVPPAGPMASYVTSRVPTDTLQTSYFDTGDGLPAEPLEKIRSFLVPGLVGRTVTCAPTDFALQLRQLLSTALPGTDWSELPFSRKPGLVEKYHLLDGSWPAPVDQATDQPMWLELGGSVRNSAEDGRALDDDEVLRIHKAHEWGTVPFTPIIHVRITAAHWANVAGFRLGVGLYE